VDRGRGVRFRVQFGERVVPAFAIRFRDQVYAYVNECAHQAVELDWLPGQFFDPDRNSLICATHGALYDPATGACRTGRCAGRPLISLEIGERNGGVYLSSETDGVQLSDVQLTDE
jgi:nitrite reductase/ring-hydroxylating ferredoxin subunit